MTSRAPLKAIFFDAGNTLLHPYPSVGHIYADTARRHGQNLSEEWVEARFQDAWRERHLFKPPVHDHEEKEFWRFMVGRVFEGVFASTHFERFFEELFSLFAEPRYWRLFPDALETLRILRRRGLRVGIVSNWDSRLSVLCEKLAIEPEVDFVVISAVEGVAKPHRDIFDRALARAGVAAAEALHIGDSFREDYEGAQAAGLRAVLLDRHGSAPQGVTSVTSLTQLLEFI